MKLGPLALFLAVLPCVTVWGGETMLATAESPDGRVRIRLSSLPPHPRLSDTILLTLWIDADKAIQVEAPIFGSALGELTILEMTEQSVRVDTNRETRKIVLKTLPQKAGSLPIWPIPIRYSDLPNGPVLTLVVPPSRINVDSAVSPETASLEEISSAYKLIALDDQSPAWSFVLFGIILAVAGIVLFLFLRWRRSVSEDAPPLTHREIALKRLANLLEDRLHESDVKKFFVALTDIVRWYIEQVSNVHAPELTTEEFLRTISAHHSGLFTVDIRERLRLFLENADYVKFAKFRPTREEIHAGFQRAEEFVMSFENEPRPNHIFRGFL